MKGPGFSHLCRWNAHWLTMRLTRLRWMVRCTECFERRLYKRVGIAWRAARERGGNE